MVLMNHFKDHKERVTCTGGSLDGRELWITAGLGIFTVLGGPGGARETYARGEGGRFVLGSGSAERRTVEMPCSQ